MTVESGPKNKRDLAGLCMGIMGIGGAGGNAIRHMLQNDIEVSRIIAANTDAQALSFLDADVRIQLGNQETEGLGAGGQPSIGQLAAEESLDEIRENLKDLHMLFIAAGMGGGTGTGAAPVIAKCARAMGILTVGFVTKPFHFEGGKRMEVAEGGIANLRNEVDTLVVIPNQNLFRIADEHTSFQEAFSLADQVLTNGIRSVVDLMVKPGMINLDFSDIRSIMQGMGRAMMGTGEAEGQDRARTAAERAINNPLLDDHDIRTARNILISITGSTDLKIYEVDEAANYVRGSASPDTNIVFGCFFDENLQNSIRISVIAAGLAEENPVKDKKGSIATSWLGERVQAEEIAQEVDAEPMETPWGQKQDDLEHLNDFLSPEKEKIPKQPHELHKGASSPKEKKVRAETSKKQEKEPEDLFSRIQEYEDDIFDLEEEEGKLNIPAFLRRTRERES